MAENTAEVSIESVTFSGGQTVEFGPSDIVVIVGPNNAGKSATLRELHARLHQAPGVQLPDWVVLTDMTIRKTESVDAVWEFIRRVGMRSPRPHENMYQLAGISAHEGTANDFVQNRYTLTPLSGWFVAYIDASSRLTLAQSQEAIDFGMQAPSHPMHRLHQQLNLTEKLAQWFKRAFGTEIAIDRMAGRTIPLHVGPDVAPRQGEDNFNEEYRKRLRSRPRLDQQGDGMRGFVGVLMHVLLGHQQISLVDEPEAFLHPPQARQLGKRVAQEHADGQVFIATHSSDFLRGALEATGRPIRVLRVRRVEDRNHASELTPEKIKEVWEDPALRYSSILDGAFHEKVVICEAEGDCRFYGAVADALRDEDEHPYARDIMFAQSGGKGGIPKLVRALKSLDVPVAAVVDFDVLLAPGQLWSIVEALGGVRDAFNADYLAVRASIDALGTTTPEAFRRNVLAVIDGIDPAQQEVSRKTFSDMQKVLKTSVGNARAKQSGLGVLAREVKPVGQRLLAAFAELGLFIVPGGELESFVVDEAQEKNAWVAAVLERYGNNLKGAPELNEARQFVSSFIKV
ncbi:ATP-dependent nuclease [Cupriavidus plantarum]|uniref:Putative ATPase n=1 Tax=Cupriavidus plantarum TaxID=942865 RepID=A0A316F4C3_9BURK|nr:AAA family ATPase [Cupriavidus plantarum]PWK38678.1 putative ATPase [Cupriavidus plantarum]